MEIILDTLAQAYDVNIAYVILMDIVIAFLFASNIILGSILGTKEVGFDLKKLAFGILKSIIVLLIIVGVCYILNLLALVIGLVGVDFDHSLLSTMELITILLTIGVDSAKEVLDKIRSFRELKYVSEKDFVISDSGIVEYEELKG